MKKRAALLGIVILLMFPFGLCVLMNGEAGSRWLLQAVFSLMPADISAKKIDGRLLERISLQELRYRTEYESIAVEHLAFAWRPAELLAGTLMIVELSADGVDVHSQGSPPSESGTFDWNAEPFLPLTLIVENLSVKALAYSDGTAVHALQNLQLSAFTERDVLHIGRLTVEAKPFNAKVMGQVTLGKGFPVSLQAGWQLVGQEYGDWRAETRITGDARRLDFESRLSSPFKSSLRGRLDDLQTKPSITARADWQQLGWPITQATPRIVSEHGAAELAGTLEDYRITLDSQLDSRDTPPARLTFSGKGSRTALAIENLKLDSKAGALQVDGRVSWQAATAFDLHATGRNFDPAIVLPELPGKLAFETYVGGELAEDALRMNVDIRRFDGQLRGKPVSAGGRLALVDDLLNIDKLQIMAGPNKISADGSLGRAGTELDFTMDAPDLAAAWPGLGGSLKGEGHLQGDWQHPAARLSAKARGLRFAEHGAGRLALDIDYGPEPDKISSLNITASGIKSAATEITTLSLSGEGSREKHAFKVNITGARETLSAQVDGQRKDNAWRGDMLKFDIDSRDHGRWRLKTNSVIDLEKQDRGLDARLSETCLIQPPASLCLRGQYLANADFQFWLKAVALPTGLAQAYFPEKWRIKGTINAEADLQRQQGALEGVYRVDMPANAVIIREGGEARLGTSSLSGTVKGGLVSADMELALLAADSVRANLQLDTGKAQILSGRIKASLKEWELVRPFMPAATNLKGLLQTDLSLRGAFAAPMIDGRLTLENAAIDLADSGVGLRDINLDALATGGPSNRIRLQGAATPVALPKAGASESLAFKGSLALKAGLQQRGRQFEGDYRLDIPAGSSIVITRGGETTRVPFAASWLAGAVDENRIFAEFDLGIGRQDFLRGQLQADTGDGKALSGRFAVSISDLALFNGLAPELSNIKGAVNGEMALAGTRQKPVVSGAIRLSEGAADVRQLGISLTEVYLSADSVVGQEGRLRFQGGAKSGSGQLRIEGYAGLNGAGEIRLNGQEFEVARLPEAEVSVSPDLKLALAGGGGKVGGRLDIPRAIMKLEDLPEHVVKVSPDEVVLGEEKVQKTPAVDVGLDAVVDIELGKDVRFSGKGLETELAGRVRIEKTGEKIVARGTIDMKNARYKSYGQDLTVRKGRFQFNGPIDAPWLDVEAIRVSKDKKVTAIVSVTGPLQSPSTRIYSEPGLPESEALAYLITGGPLSQATKGEGEMIASAALSYGAGRLSWLTEKLGVDEFEVEQGDTLQDSLVSAGQYLTSNLYVGTRLGLFNKQAVLVLKQKLTEAINVETQTGTSHRIKLNYEFDAE